MVRFSSSARTFAAVLVSLVLSMGIGASADTTGQPFVSNDPYFAPAGGGASNGGQWYLYDTYNPGLDINVLPAWNRGITGQGIVIGIVDDCLQTNQPDIAPNYRADLSWNFGNNTMDPSPVNSSDMHGTSVAGLAAARGGNGIGITGVAPYAGLAGLRVDFTARGETQRVNATLYKSDLIRVKNHSYTQSDTFISDDALVAANRASADMGCINVRAAGNLRTNANAFAAQADRTSLTVAALGIDGKYASYSNYGACVFVTAPSSGGTFNGYAARVTTTDLAGPAGYNNGVNQGFSDSNYNVSFGGTSASAPIVSGAVAMILQVNPSLDIRGVKYVLAKTSRMVDPTDSNWITNAAGYHFNPNYGFGLIDVDAATRCAATFQQPGPEISYTSGIVQVDQDIPDNDPTGLSFRFHMNGAQALETVELAVNATDRFPADLEIDLTSPSGTVSELAYPRGPGAYAELGFNWTFSSAAFWGENATGDWTMHIADDSPLGVGALTDFTLTAYAAAPDPCTLSLIVLGCLGVLARRNQGKR